MSAAEIDLDRAWPGPVLTPRDVVKIQVEALRLNEELGNDQGIAIAFRFASPANREVTGPVDRFATLLRNPLYRPMLDHAASRLGPTHMDGDIARVQAVLFGRNGEVAAYDVTLSKDEETGSWMTDSVMLSPVEMA